MNIIYISSFCTEKRNKEIQSISKELNFNFQSRKFHKLLIQGLHKNNANIICYSVCSILSRSMNKKILKKNPKNIEHNIQFIAPSVLFIPIVQQIQAIINTYIFLFRYFSINKEKTVILCDTLEAFYSLGVILFCKLHKKKCIAIVTDLPSDSVGRGKTNFLKKCIVELYSYFFDRAINNYNGYILLSKYMNNVVNKKNKPNIIIEGLVEIKNDIEKIEKYKKKVILFAGSLEKRFGIQLLLEAFSLTNNPNYELHIYGKGNAENIINEFTKKDFRIKFYGVVPNETILIEEKKAWLLVNPRLTVYEYVKYSFPSKNMEYLNSGTCVLTTCLPSMPIEHYDYVFTIDEEEPEFLKSKLEYILNTDEQELLEFGKKAKKFVGEKKNNFIQAKKVLDLCEELYD